jgi:hypothetical protein
MEAVIETAPQLNLTAQEIANLEEQLDSYHSRYFVSSLILSLAAIASDPVLCAIAHSLLSINSVAEMAIALLDINISLQIVTQPIASLFQETF